MRAILVREHGGPEVLRLEQLPDPVPGAGELLVRVEAAGLNFIDVYDRTGLYPSRPPFTPGREGAGVVEAVGPGVDGFGPGDAVAWAMVPGSYAELQTVPAAKAVRVPDGVTTRDAAAAMLQGMTAHYLATSTRPLGPGDVCLVHAAAGGVGLLLCQVARMRGARVIGTASTPEKQALAREAGAEEVIRYTKDSVVDAVARLTGGRGVQVVYDSVGRDTFEDSLDCLAARGTLVLFGQSSGPVAAFDPQVLNPKGSLFLTRPSLGHYIATPEELAQRAGEVFAWLREGRLELRVDRALPLADAADAHRALEGRETKGKVLLVP